MARIAVFEVEDENEVQELKRSLPGHKISFYSEPLSLENFSKAAGCDGIVIFVYSRIDKKLISHLPKLKLVATMSSGYDHIDIKACSKLGITVCNVPSYGEHTVAEHTFALLLAISRKLIPSVNRAKAGDFSLEGLTGFDLEGKTLGIVGTGKIGSLVAKLANCFGMNIIAFSKHRNLELEKQYGLKYLPTMKALLERSDVISLHAPLSKETFHLINKKNIKFIKKGAVLINTARGALVETEALFEALKTGTIRYAGLDVLEEERFIKEEKELLSPTFRKNVELKTILANHILLNQENVIVTPHNAFNSEEAVMKIVSVTSDNINSFFKKRRPANQVQL